MMGIDIIGTRWIVIGKLGMVTARMKKENKSHPDFDTKLRHIWKYAGEFEDGLQVCMSSEIHEIKLGTIHYEPQLPLGRQRQGFGFMLNISYSNEEGKLRISLHLLPIGLSRGFAPTAGGSPRRFIFRLDADQQSKSAPTAIVVCPWHWAIHSWESWCHTRCRTSIYRLRWW